MPKSSTSSRGERDRDADSTTKSKSSSKSSRDDEYAGGDRKSKRDRRQSKSSSQGGEKSRSANGMAEEGQSVDGLARTSNGEQDNQSRPPEHEALSSHVQDQFPGQFPAESAEPYRPPLAASEGGPGLAAEYYGDAGQSVAEQPGFRKQSPSLIIGQEPHLLPASSVAAPPPEPSASGGVGAAASFFSGEFDADETTSSHVQQASSTYSSAPSRPNTVAESSNLSSLGSATIGTAAAVSAAAGYSLSNRPSSSRPQNTTSTTGSASGNDTVTGQRPQSQSQDSYYSAPSRPPTSGNRPSHADNIPIYAAAAAGVAGLAGTALHTSEHHSTSQASHTQQFAEPTTPRHRHRGPFGALVDFVRDPEGVAQFEEYSEFVGICRGCFEPGSSPRDAPRRHRHFNRKRSDERIGRVSRVEKRRVDGSSDEKGDRNSPSWLSGGIAGYGLGKMGERIFKQSKDFDDTYSVKSGRYSPESGKRYRERRESDEERRRRRKSEDELKTGVTSGGSFSVDNSDIFGAASSNHNERRQGRLGSRDRESKLASAAVGVAASEYSSHRRSHSGDRKSSKSRRRTRNGSESDTKGSAHRKKNEKTKKGGFFSFGSNSSSSSLDKAYSRSGKSSKNKSDDKKAEAALLGLGAAAAALAAADSRPGHRKNGVKELVGRKETRDERFQRPPADEAGWEDEEDYVSEAGSIDSGLAFGGDSDGSSGHRHDRRRRSEMSGKGSLPGRRSSWDNGKPPVTSFDMSPEYHEGDPKHERPSPTLQYVDPVPIPDFQHLDERMEASEPFPSRPPLVSHPSEDMPFHQPQPKSRVSSSIYTTPMPYSQINEPSAGPSMRYTPSARRDRSFETQPSTIEELKLSRRATLPANFEAAKNVSESTRRRKPSVKDDSSVPSGVRFALPEDDKDERREKRRRRKDAEKAEDLETESRAATVAAGREDKISSKRVSEARDVESNGLANSSGNSWTTPAAVGLVGAAVVAAAAAEHRAESKTEETKDERRERRRREKRRENHEGQDDSRAETRRREKVADEEEVSSKRERERDDDREETREERKARRRAERKERERNEREEDAVVASDTPRVSFGKLPRRTDAGDEKEIHTDEQESSSKQEVYQHEDYSSFFTPAIDNTNDQQVKISGANADADISFDQSPNFVIAEPRELRDQSGTPEFSPTDTFDRVDRSALRFPWQIPRLRLLYPTPPSTRGSTPIIEPRERPEQDNPESSEIVPDIDISSTGNQQRGFAEGYDVSSPKASEVNDRYTDPPSDDDSERWRRRKPKKIPLSIDQEDIPGDADMYGNDNNFAAVLAASAEDAGFDPSIVIDNPKYRRRESPPGSDAAHVPGSFEDADDKTSFDNGKMEGSISKRQGPPKERDDDAIVENIVSQVEEKDSGKTNEDPKADEDVSNLVKSKKSKKSKKGSRRSLINDEASEDLRSAAVDDKSQTYEEQKAETRSVIGVFAQTSEDGNRNNSTAPDGDGESANQAATSVAPESTIKAAGANTKASGLKKGSIWDRVLGKTASVSSAPNEDVDLTREDSGELSRKESKKNKKSKRKSSQSGPGLEDGGGEEGTDDGRNEDFKVNRSVTSPPESVAQYLTKESDTEPSKEPGTESFLGERPDPPPPPDMGTKSEKLPDMATTKISARDLENQTPSEKHSRWPAEISTSDGPLSPKSVSSPTAVPIHFRRPALPKARSSSQSPLSSSRIADDGSQTHPPRPRPRSTQFENSKEYRPLWLVERNQSRQDVPSHETYPPLPSSHSTSRDSSLHSDSRQRDDNAPEITSDSKEEDHDLPEERESRAMELDLLDSQQPTPTASSFSHTFAKKELLPSNSRSGSLENDQKTHPELGSSNIELASVAAVAGGITAYTIHQADRKLESSTREEPQVKFAEGRGGFEDSAPYEEKDEPFTLNEDEDLAPQRKKKKKKNGKKVKSSKEQFAEQRDVAMIEASETLDQEGDPSSIAPLRARIDQDPTENKSSNEAPKSATLASQNSDIVTDRISENAPADDVETKYPPYERIDLENHPSKKLIALDAGNRITIPSDDSRETVMPSKDYTQGREKGVELSPLSTPLPEGDDFDLFNEPPLPQFDNSSTPLAKDGVTSSDNIAKIVERNEQARTNIEPPTSKMSESSRNKTDSGHAVLDRDPEEVAQSLQNEVVDDPKLVGMDRHIEVMEPAAEEDGNNSEFPDENVVSNTKKRSKKSKQSKQGRKFSTAPQNTEHETQDVGVTKDVLEQDEFKEGQISDPIPLDSLADAPDAERRVDASVSPNVQPNDDDQKEPTNKKKSKKDKKKKKILSLEEQELPEPRPMSPKLAENAEKGLPSIDEGTLEEHKVNDGDSHISTGEKSSLVTSALPLVLSQASDKSLPGRVDSEKIIDEQQDNTSGGDKPNLVPVDVEDSLSGFQSDEKADHVISKSLSTEEDGHAGICADEEDSTILPQETNDGGASGAEYSNIAVTAEGMPKNDIKSSTTAGEHQLNISQDVADATLDKSTSTQNLNSIIVNDDKNKRPEEADLSTVAVPESSKAIENLEHVDPNQSDDKPAEAEDFSAFPIKKSKKDKKGKKPRKETAVATDIADAKSVEPFVDEALQDAETGGPDDISTKPSKKEKRTKKRDIPNLNTLDPEPVESEADLDPGQVEPTTEAIEDSLAPAEAEESALPSSKQMSSVQNEVEKDEWDDTPVKKSKKGKKGKTGIPTSTAEIKTSEVSQISLPDRARTSLENEEIDVDLPKDVKPAISEETIDKPDLQEQKLVEGPDEQIISKTKKGKKKAKKSKAFSWDDDPGLPAEGEEIGTKAEASYQDVAPTEINEDVDGAIKTSFNSGDLQEENKFPIISKETDDQKDATIGKDFSWGAYKSKGVETELLPDTKTLDEDDPTGPGSKEESPAVSGNISSKGSPRNSKIISKRDTDDYGEDKSYFVPKTAESDDPRAKTPTWDEEATIEEKNSSLPKKTDLERPDSYVQVRADEVEVPVGEHTQSSVNVLDKLTGPLTLPVEGPSDVPDQLTFADIIEPSTVEEPHASEAQNSLSENIDESPLVRDVVETNQEPTLAKAKKGKKIKKPRKDKSGDINSMDKELLDRDQGEGDQIERQEVEPTPVDHTEHSNDETSTDKSKSVLRSVQINEQPEIIEQHAKSAEVHKRSSPPSTPLSAGSVDMLDADQQREYNEEYNKQLQKELNSPDQNNDMLDSRGKPLDHLNAYIEPERLPDPLGDGRQGVQPRDPESFQVQFNTNQETDQIFSTINDTNPHQPSLSAIAEEKESQWNSISPQRAIPSADNSLERKKSKRGKKSKQSSKPVIWEDETATPKLVGTPQQPLDGHAATAGLVEDGRSQEGSRVVYDDLPSPTRGSPSASRSPKFDDAAEDYFAVRPRAKTEKNLDAHTGFEEPEPDQSQDLPDWSSQPKEPPMAAQVDGTPISKRRGSREGSLSRDLRSSDEFSHQARAPLQGGEAMVSEVPDSIGETTAVAAALGAGVVGATIMSKEESKKGKKGRKGKKSTRKADFESNEIEDKQGHEEDTIDDPDFHDSIINSRRKRERYDDRRSQSPDRSNGFYIDHKDSQQEQQPNYRDSAIQIADSPVIPVPEVIHRPLHDSGYPATEASPVINDSNDYDAEHGDIVDPYTDARIGTTGFYHDDEERPISMASDPRHSIIESDDQEASGNHRRSSRRRRRRDSNVKYDSDDSNDSGYDKQRRLRKYRQTEELRDPSPISSTTKNRSSALFDSSPSDRQILEHHGGDIPESDQAQDKPLEDSSVQDKSRDIAEHQNAEFDRDADRSTDLPKSIFGGPWKEEERSRSRSPTNSDVHNRRQLEKISEDSLEDSPLARKGKRDLGDVGLPDSGVKARRTSHDISPLGTSVAAGAVAIGSEDLFKRLHKTPKDDDDRSQDTERSSIRSQDRPRRLSNQSNASAPARDSEWRRQALKSPDSIHAIIRTPPDQVRSSSGQSLRSSGTPPLRRVDRSISGDLRGANREIDAKRRAKIAEAEPAQLDIAAETVASSSTYDPLTDKGKHRGDMADVFEGEGRQGHSPNSPTRLPNVRKRQSLQFADLEQRFEQLAADHRSLQSAKSAVERRLDEQARDHSQQRQTYEEALQEHKSYLVEKDSELTRLHEILDGFRRQVTELAAVNEELQTSRELDPDRVGDQSFQILAGQHETTKKELEDLREKHTRLADDHEDMLEREIEAVRQEKDHEMQQLIAEVESAKEEVKALKQQILTLQSSDDYVEHDEDYFETRCTALCQHVQQWVLRFSKFSDSHACRLVGELGDDTLSDLFDDAILDGTEVDDYLQDRIKRRDVFMSVVMSRIFDFIFRRYLFGLDREQRKKLKDLEGTLVEVGPQSAVHKWRSTTLSLLSSRPEFADQREEDTEGVVESIFQTLAAILPPKRDLVPQITDSLRRVVAMAVDLHIEMRLQRAEFQMLPPLKPQFDPVTGDLVRKVPFNAEMMNERSGNTESNEQLQEEGAVIRMVLFPLVVRNSDEEEQIVVCPAQVIVAKDEPRKRSNGKQVRVMSAQGARSEASFIGTEDSRMSVEGGMF